VVNLGHVGQNVVEAARRDEAHDEAEALADALHAQFVGALLDYLSITIGFAMTAFLATAEVGTVIMVSSCMVRSSTMHSWLSLFHVAGSSACFRKNGIS
jgi:hypothetical protein